MEAPIAVDLFDLGLGFGLTLFKFGLLLGGGGGTDRCTSVVRLHLSLRRGATGMAIGSAIESQ